MNTPNARALLLFIVAALASPLARAHDRGPSRNGDVNASGGLDVGDVVYLMNYLYLGGPPPRPLAAPSRQPTTIFFVRHAETDDRDCPEVEQLGELGLERASVLAERFARAELTHLVATYKTRTQQTLQFVASDHGLDITVVPGLPPGVGECDGEFASAGRTVEATIEFLGRKIPPGSAVLVAGHSSTIFPVMIGLGVPDTFPRDENGNLLKVRGHDNLFAVTLGATPAAPAKMVSLRFGDPCSIACPVEGIE